MADGVSRPPEIARSTDDHAADAPLSQGLAFGGATPPVTALAAAPHADKFRIALAALVGIAIGAVAITVALLSSGSTKTIHAVAWSSWSPGGSGSGAVTEIADHLAPYYRISAANQLDVVTPVALTNPNPDGTISHNGLVVAVNASTGSSSAENLSLLGGKTVAYNICGMGGSNCALGGKPSPARLLLLRREALELALYTFKYISGTQNVVVILPPGHTSTSTSTLSGKPPSSKAARATGKPVTIGALFVRSELQPWLNEPVTKTLQQFPPDVAQLPVWSKGEEAGLVDQITGRGLFSEQVESQQTGGSLLVLKPVPPQ